MTIPILALLLASCSGDVGLGPMPIRDAAFEILPGDVTVDALGDTRELRVRATDGFGRPSQLPDPVWRSLKASVVEVDESGRVRALATGVGRIVASRAGAADTATVTVRQLAVSLSVVPAVDTLTAIGQRSPLRGAGYDANGHQLRPDQLTWTTRDPSIVTVDAEGVLTARRVGSIEVDVANFGGLEATALIVVRPRHGTLSVKPELDTLSALGETLQLLATETDSSGHAVGEIQPSWRSLEPAVADIDQTGLVTTRANGTARLIAETESLADTAFVVVRQLPVWLTITPRTPILAAPGESVQLAAAVEDANRHEVPAQTVTWRAADPTVASVDATGLVTSHALGSTWIAARVQPDGPADSVRVAVGSLPAPQAGVYTPTGIDATGGTDVTTPLLAFLNSVPDGSTIQFPAGARYRVEGTLLLEDRHGLAIDGNGATIFATTDGSGVTPPRPIAHRWPRGRRHWLFRGGSGITIRDMTVRGANSHAGTSDEAWVVALEAQHGFDFEGVDGVELSNVTVTDVYGDFVYIGAHDRTWTRNVHVHDNHFERNGRQGIAITGGEDVLIERNYVGEVRRSSVDLEPNATIGGARRITVRDNTFGRGRLLWVASAGRGPNVGDVLFADNRLVDKQIQVVIKASDGARRGPFTFLRNISDRQLGSGLGAAIRVHRVDGLTVRGNLQPMQPNRDMLVVWATESCDVSVSQNTAPNMGGEVRTDPYSCP